MTTLMPGAVDVYSAHVNGETIETSDVDDLQDAMLQVERIVVGSPWQNVLYHGAIRTTNNEAAHTANANAWTAAVAALPTGGGVIYFPPGTYYVGTAGLTYTSTKALTIMGWGRNTVTIRKGSGPDVSPIALSGEVLTIGDGTTPSMSSIQIEGIRFTGSNDASLTGSGVKLFGPQLVSMRNVHIAQMAEHGLWIRAGSLTTAYMNFTDCLFNLNKKHGIFIDESGGGAIAAIQFANCTTSSNGQSGQDYHGMNINGSSEVMNVGCNFSDNLGAGVSTSSTGYLKLTGCDIVGNYRGGLILDSSFLSGIVGNNFHGNLAGTAPGSEANILLKGNPCTGNSIIGNQINGAGGQAVDYGIREEGSATNNVILGNTFVLHDTSTYATKISLGNASSTTVVGFNPGSEYQYGAVPASVAAATNITGAAATITVGAAPISIYRFTLGSGAQTGAIITAGLYTGQELTLINTDATDSLTFAVAGTSRVADGTSAVVAALTAMKLIWDHTAGLWFKC